MATGPFAQASAVVRGRYLLLDARRCRESGVERWTAYDPELARRVQLCVVAITTEEQSAAVMARARALAGVAHRSVAAVLDVGATAEAIYIATELVEGESIMDHGASHGLDARAWWRLFASAARGLATAHAAGVAHGSIAAADLRIADGRPCVVDFAIASAGSIATDVQNFAALVVAQLGRPAWLVRMLQSAARGEVSSLGELLDRIAAHDRRRSQLAVAGIAGAAVVGMLAWRPASPSEAACTGAARHLDGVWDDARREELHAAYAATSAPWAADVERLVDERIDAHAVAWAREHTDACRATRIDRTQSEAVLEQRMACLQRRRVELAALVDTLLGADKPVLARGHDAAAGLEDVEACADVNALGPASVDPVRADAIATGLARARTLRDTGEYGRALALATPWVAAAHDLGDGLLRARGELLLADLEDRLGARDAAERTLLAALWSAEAVHADREIAEAWIELSWIHGFRRGDRSSGERAADHAAHALQRMGGDPSLESHRLGNLGYVLEVAGAYDDAVAKFEASLALHEQTFGPDDPRLAQPLNGLGMTLKNQGEYDRSAAVFERTLALLARTVGPEHPQNATVLANIGNLARARGRLDEAETAHRRALELWRASTGEHSSEVASAYHNLGTLYIDRGDYDAAVDSFRHAIEVFTAMYGDRHVHIGTVRSALGYALYLRGEYAQARTEYERALAVQTAAFGDEHPFVANTRTNLGLALHMLGDLDGAAEQHRRALAIMEAKLGPDHPNLVTALANLGEALLAKGDAAGALPALERAAAIGDRTGVATGAMAQGVLGRAYLRLGRAKAAITALEHAIELLEASGADPQRTADFRADLAEARAAR